MSTFSPKKIKDGFILRWSQQTLDLVVRHPIIWIIYLTSLFLLSNIKLPIYFFFIISIWFITLGFNIIALSDSKFFNFTNLLHEFKSSFIDTFYNIYLRPMACIIFFVLLYYISNKTQSATSELLVINFNLIFLAPCFLFFLGFLFFSPSSNLYYHYFRKFFNVNDKKIIVDSCFQSLKINLKIAVFFSIYFLINLLFITNVLPILIIILAPLTLGFVYLSFREMFLDKDKNEELIEDSEILPIINLR